MHIVAAKAVCFAEALRPEFTAYQQQIVKNAQALASGLMSRGFKLSSGGTENHLMLIDLRGTGVTGKVGEEALGKADITVNKNMIPYDPEQPMTTSGVRVGTPAVTTRGLREPEMDVVADCIARVLRAPTDDAVLAAVRRDVHALTKSFPLYARMLRELDAMGPVGTAAAAEGLG
jgi:glycine hydroxymethyltransferase